MTAIKAPCYGIWAAYRGQWVLDPRTERLCASFDQARDQVLSAERAGFDTVLFAQHTINPLDQTEEILEAWTAAAAAAALTSRIEIIGAIKPRLYHPAVLAKMALGIEDISHGRFAINVVNAWFRPELDRAGIGFPDHEIRYEYGREWLEVYRALVSGEAVTHRGENFQLDNYTLRPKSRHRARPVIYAGGESEPGRQLAADFADVWLINGRPVEDIAPMVADVAARPRAGTPLDFGITGFSLSRPTEAEARQALDALFAIQDSYYDSRRAEMQKQIDPKSQAIRSHTKYPGARMIGANGGTLAGLVGSYDQVAERIAAFHDAGVSVFLLSFFPLEAEQERFAAEVIPRVSRLIGDRRVVS